MTGGAGAIGANVVRAVLERGDDVTVLDNLSSGQATHLPDQVRFVCGSTTSADDVREAFADGPEVVFHLAALFANQNSIDHPADDLLTNGLGTLRVFEAAAAAQVRRVVNVSSSVVYGARATMREDDGVGPLDTPYAITKLLGEHYASFWARAYGLPIVSTRMFNVYGPYERPGKHRNVVSKFIAAALAGEPLVITGTGDETRDFTFMADAVRGMLLASTADVAPGTVVNIASGVATPVRRVAELVNELSGNGAGVVFQPRRAWDRIGQRLADISRARCLLGYEPTVALEEGLSITVDWLRHALVAT